MTGDANGFAERLKSRRSFFANQQRQQTERERVQTEQQHQLDLQRQRVIASFTHTHSEPQEESSTIRGIKETIARQTAELALQAEMRAQLHADGVQASAILQKMGVKTQFRSFIREVGSYPKGYFFRDTKAWLLQYYNEENRYTRVHETYGRDERPVSYVTAHESSAYGAYVLTTAGDVLESHVFVNRAAPATLRTDPTNSAIFEFGQKHKFTDWNKDGFDFPALNEQRFNVFRTYLTDIVLFYQGRQAQ